MCPFNPNHPQYEAYCGVPNVDYIEFLKTLRSRVEAWSDVIWRQDHVFKRLQETVDIDETSQGAMQNAYRRFQHSTSLLRGANSCVPGPKKTPAQIQYCPLCSVGDDGCEGNPVGVAAGDGGGNWCQKNCQISKAGGGKQTLAMKEEAKLRREAKREFTKLTLAVMRGNLEEVGVTLFWCSLAHNPYVLAHTPYMHAHTPYLLAHTPYRASAPSIPPDKGVQLFG